GLAGRWTEQSRGAAVGHAARDRGPRPAAGPGFDRGGENRGPVGARRQSAGAHREHHEHPVRDEERRALRRQHADHALAGRASAPRLDVREPWAGLLGAMTSVWLALLVPIATLVALPLRAQQSAPKSLADAVFDALQWRSIRPANTRGPITDVEGFPTPPKRGYAGPARAGSSTRRRNPATSRPLFAHDR